MWCLDETKGQSVVVGALELVTEPAIATTGYIRSMTYKAAQLLLAEGKSSFYRADVRPSPRSLCPQQVVEPKPGELLGREKLPYDPVGFASIPRALNSSRSGQAFDPLGDGASCDRTTSRLESYQTVFQSHGLSQDGRSTSGDHRGLYHQQPPVSDVLHVHMSSGDNG
jgi:hypothetical protein